MAKRHSAAQNVVAGENLPFEYFFLCRVPLSQISSEIFKWKYNQLDISVIF